MFRGRALSSLLGSHGRWMASFAVGLIAAAGFVSGAGAQTAQFSFAQGAIANGGGLSQGLDQPISIAVDGSGNVYIADTVNNRVLKVPAADLACATAGDCTTVGSGLDLPYGVALDSSGNVYIADTYNHRVLKVPASDPTCATAGDCTTVGSGLDLPAGVKVDEGGNVYIADGGNSNVLKVPAVDLTCITAGDCINVGSGLKFPRDVAVDGSGDVYIADTYNNRVVRVPATDLTCATSGDCTTVGAGLSSPQGVTVDGSGNVYIGDSNNNRVLKVPATDLTCATASDCTTVGSGLNFPRGVVLDGNGNIYIADSYNNRVLKVQTAEVNFSTVAVGQSTALSLIFIFNSAGTIGAPVVVTQGAANLDFTDAGTGSCTTNGTSYSYSAGDTCTVNVNFKPEYAGVRYGAAELVNGSGAVIATAYVYGTGSGPQVGFSPAAQSTIASGSGLSPGLVEPYGVAVDGAGNVYIADWGSSRVVKAPAADAACATTGDCTMVGIGLNYPHSVAVDGAGNIYIADTWNQRVLKVPATDLTCAAGDCTTVGSSLSPSLREPYGVAVDGSGNVYIADSGNDRVLRAPATDLACATAGDCTTVASGSGLSPGLGSAWGVAADGGGNVYIVDWENNRVVRAPATDLTCAAAGDCTTVGSGLNQPEDVAVDGSGNVYIADHENNRVLKAPATDLTCATAGDCTTVGSSLNFPLAVAVDGSDNVYIVDTFSPFVLKEDLADAPSLSFATITEAGTTDSTDGSLPVTIANNGNVDLTFSQGPSILSSNFTLDGNSCGTTLTPGAQCTLSVEFTPGTGLNGSLGSSLLLTDNALNAAATQTIPLSGNSTDAPYITSPTPGSTLAGGSTTFTWSPGGAGATQYELRVGTGGVNSSDIYNSGIFTGTQATANIPAYGVTVFVRLYYRVGNGAWNTIDYTYMESGSPTLPSMTTPAPGSTLISATGNSFCWNPGQGPALFELRLGTTRGGSDVYNGAPATAATCASGITVPANAETLYAALDYELDGRWYSIDYTYVEPGSQPPALTSPAAGSSPSGTNVNFSWSPGVGNDAYQLFVGTEGVGATNLFASGVITADQATVPSIPAYGVTVYVRLYYRHLSTWNSLDYTFTESGSPTPPALTSPAPGSTLTSATGNSFCWNPGDGPSMFVLHLGTTKGASDVYISPSATAATCASGITVPTGGATLYATLSYQLSGRWYSVSTTYIEP